MCFLVHCAPPGFDTSSLGVLHDGQGHYYLMDHEEEVFLQNSVTVRLTHMQHAFEVQRGLSESFGVKEVRIVHFPTCVVEYFFHTEEETWQAASWLETHPDVVWVEPVFTLTRKTSGVLSSSSLPWHLQSAHVEEAWEISQGSSDIVIAVIDSGIDMFHPEWQDKIVAPRDLLYRDDDPSADLDDPHGTESAGVAVASGNNPLGIVGVCPRCSIMPLRIMGTQGFSRTTADADAIRWAADHGAHILSNSWAPPVAGVVSHNLADALQWALYDSPQAQERLVVFASGNEGKENPKTDVRSLDGVLSVGASDPEDGVYPYSNGSLGVHVVAPTGSSTTTLRTASQNAWNGYTQKFIGTSASCPVVAGTLGLMKTLNPYLTRQTALQFITTTTDPLQSSASPSRVGYGKVNAFKALQAVATKPPVLPSNTYPEDNTPPYVSNTHTFILNAEPALDLSFDPPQTTSKTTQTPSSCYNLNTPASLWILWLSMCLRIFKRFTSRYLTKEKTLETHICVQHVFHRMLGL